MLFHKLLYFIVKCLIRHLYFNMNKIKAFLILLIAFTSISFTDTRADIKEVKVKESKVVWKGYKVAGSHTGIIALKAGALLLDGEVLKGGDFVVDMTSISCTDLESKRKEKLEKHLKSDAFFGVEKYPTALLTLTKVKASGENEYNVSGDLTIKGKKDAVNFVISVFGNSAKASLKIDRTKYGVTYANSSFFDGLKDKVIDDEFDIIVDLKF